MTFDEFKILIKPLAVHFGAMKDPPTWRLYHAALMHPPAPTRALLERALPRAASSRRFFPSPEELRRDAEAERQEMLKANPFTPCDRCQDSSGWVSVIDQAGHERMVRCECFDAYRHRLAAAGVGADRLALPPAEPQQDGLQ